MEALVRIQGLGGQERGDQGETELLYCLSEVRWWFQPMLKGYRGIFGGSGSNPRNGRRVVGYEKGRGGGGGDRASTLFV